MPENYDDAPLPDYDIQKDDGSSQPEFEEKDDLERSLNNTSKESNFSKKCFEYQTKTGNIQSTLESRVDELARKRIENAQKIKEYKREAAIYAFFGSTFSFLTLNLMMESAIPLRFGSMTHFGILFSGAFGTGAVSYVLFRTALERIDNLIDVKNQIDKIYKEE